MFQRIFRGSFSPIFQWGYWATSGELANLCLWGWQHRWCPPFGGTARQVAGHCSQNEWKAGPQVPGLMEPHVRKPSTNQNLLKSALLYYLKSNFLNSTSWFFFLQFAGCLLSSENTILNILWSLYCTYGLKYFTFDIYHNRWLVTASNLGALPSVQQIICKIDFDSHLSISSELQSGVFTPAIFY